MDFCLTKDEQLQIQAFLEKRQVSSCYHITDARNTESIAESGLVRRFLLEHDNWFAYYADLNRLDNHKDSVSLSVGQPNRWLLRKYRERFPRRSWCILRVDTSVLWSKPCAFFERNAAESRMRWVAPHDRLGPPFLERMFGHGWDSQTRTYVGRRRDSPTWKASDDQAEVLVMDEIEPRYIESVVFEREDERRRYQRLLSSRDIRAEVKEFKF